MHENEDFLNSTSNKVKYDPMIFKFSVSMGNIVNFDNERKKTEFIIVWTLLWYILSKKTTLI